MVSKRALSFEEWWTISLCGNGLKLLARASAIKSDKLVLQSLITVGPINSSEMLVSLGARGAQYLSFSAYYDFCC